MSRPSLAAIFMSRPSRHPKLLNHPKLSVLTLAYSPALYLYKKIIGSSFFAYSIFLLPLQRKTDVEGFELIATTIKKC